MPEIKIKSEKKKKPLNISAFLTSDKQEDIYDLIVQYKGKISTKKLHERILKLDPKLPGYPAFCNFLSKVDLAKEKRAGEMLLSLKDAMQNDTDTGAQVMKKLLENAYKKIFVAGNLAINQQLEEIMAQVNKGEPIRPDQQKLVMEWFFKAQDAMTKQRTVDLKANADERAETLMDNLIMGAQYQAYDPADVVDGDYEEIDKSLPNKHKKLTEANASK